MQEGRKLAALRRVLGQESFRKNDELIFFCKSPYGCRGEHHRAKLSVNMKTDRFHCWVCGWKGPNLAPILKLGDGDVLRRYLEENTEKRCDSDGVEDRRYNVPTLPEDFRTLSRLQHRNPYYDGAWRYLISRNISFSDALRFKLGYCEEGEYRYRIIIPSFDENGELNFFVGRKFYESVGMSYKHGKFDKDIVFNDYLIDWDEPVTLVEGPFDAMIAGDNAVPLQGKELREDSLLFRKIVTSPSRSVHIALDSDAWKQQCSIANSIMRFGVTVGFIDLRQYGVKDVGEMTKDAFQRAKSEAFYATSTMDVLKLRART